MRGKVDVGEANELLREQGHDDLRFLDNGAIGRPMEGIEGPAHAYHLVPGGASKAKGVAFHRARAATRPTSASRLATRWRTWRRREAVGRFFCVANGPARDEALRDALSRYPNVDRDRGRHGRRLLRGCRCRPSRCAEGRPLNSISNGLRITRPTPRRSTSRSCSGSRRPGCRSPAPTSPGRCSSRPPTVHEMIGRLERDGYVSRSADKSLRSPPTAATTRRRSSGATG